MPTDHLDEASENEGFEPEPARREPPETGGGELLYKEALERELRKLKLERAMLRMQIAAAQRKLRRHELQH